MASNGRRSRRYCNRRRPSVKSLMLCGWILLGVLPTSSPLHASDEFADRSAESIRRTTDEILDAPEFRHLRKRQTRQQSDSEKNDNETKKRDEESSSLDFPSMGVVGDAVGFLFHGIAWLGLLVVCAAIVYLVIQALQHYGSPELSDTTATPHRIEGEAEPENAPGQFAADVYRARAEEFASVGQFREALAQLLFGAMSQIERAGLIRYRRGLTFRDYLRAVRGNQSLYRSMRSLVRGYEPIGFGRRSATQEQFSSSMADYEAGFRADIKQVDHE